MASGVINVLNNVNTGLVLANTAGTVIVPLVKTIVQSIKGIQSDQGTMDYEIVLKVGAADLAEADTNFQAGLDTINAELERLGKPKV